MRDPGGLRPARREVLLAAASGLLLGCAFPPFPTGALALVGFLPLFIVLEEVDSYRRTVKFSYVAFFVLNAVTLYWPGGFVHASDFYLMAAGALLVLVHPLFFCLPMLAWTFCRKRFGFKAAMAAFPVLWVAFEYAHSATELAFPWLLLGYTQSYDLDAIQIASFMGAYGLSVWVAAFNVLVYVLYAKLVLGEWPVRSARAIGFCVFLLGLFVAPKLYGWIAPEAPDTGQAPVRVAAIQPNIDPFEKWEGGSQPQQEKLIAMTGQIAPDGPDLVLWPETAIPYYVLDPANRVSFEKVSGEINRLGLNLLSGIPDIVYAREGETPHPDAKVSRQGRRYTTYNSSMLLRSDSSGIQKYAKMKLVPFAERVPYSAELKFLNAMNWNFGLGGWTIGEEQTVFRFRTRDGRTVRFANMICFESVYPGFVAEFVKGGAEFITVITNDSWWGRTSGPVQHRQIAVFRAIENRRWVVQCANGGISCFIDPSGHILQESRMYEETKLLGEVYPRRELSFYSQHPDWPALLCGFLTLFVLTAGLGQMFYATMRRRQAND